MPKQVSQQPHLTHIARCLERFSTAQWQLAAGHSAIGVWRQSWSFHVLYEVVYLVALISFVVGSIFFLPEYDDWLDVGCNLFIFGSVVLAAMLGYETLEEAVNLCGVGVEIYHTDDDMPEAVGCERNSRAWGVVIEKLGYFAGSVIFAVGTVFWEHPRTIAADVPGSQDTKEVDVWATELFIVGSAVFALAAFVNALTLHERHPTFVKWAIAACACYEVGGVLFVIGSVCFLPNMGCAESMLVLAAWCFIIGSLFYVLAAGIGLLKTLALFQLEQEDRDEDATARADSETFTQTASQSTAADSSQGLGGSLGPEYPLSPITECPVAPAELRPRPAHALPAMEGTRSAPPRACGSRVVFPPDRYPLLGVRKGGEVNADENIFSVLASMPMTGKLSRGYR